MRAWVFIAFLATSLATAQRLSSTGGSAEHQSDLEITWHIFKPPELPAPDVAHLHVPAGFRIQKFAENLGNARILAIGPNGNVYVTRREEGDVLNLPLRAKGIVVQHFNTDPDKPVRFVATEPSWLEATFVDRGSGYEQLEDAPEYKA